MKDIKKNITKLSFCIDIINHDMPFEEDGYGEYTLKINDDMKLSEKDKSNELRTLREISNFLEGDMATITLAVYNEDAKIGTVTCYLIDKVKSIASFVGDSECKSGDAGVCACEIVENKLFKKLVQHKRYANIEWINLDEEYKTIENELMVLEKIVLYLKNVYEVKHVFTRPVPYDLTEEEWDYLRTCYFDIELDYYVKYGQYMVGYVYTYYTDIPQITRKFDNMPISNIVKIMKNYMIKQEEIHDAYKKKGFRLLGKNFGGVLYV